MNIIWINDFIVKDKFTKNYPFMEIIEYIDKRELEIIIITLKLIIKGAKKKQVPNYFIFEKEYYNDSNKNRFSRLQKFIIFLIKGSPIYLVKKLIQLKQEKTVVHLFSGFITSFFGALTCKLLNLPCIIGPNAIPSKNLIFKNISKLSNIKFFIRDLIISRLPCNKFLCFSNYHQYILNKKFRISDKKMEIIGIGINPRRFHILKLNNSTYKLFNNMSKTILYVGLPIEEKGFYKFIKICKLLIDRGIIVNIIIIGIKNKKLRLKLKRELKQLTKNIHIFGWISRLNLIYYYNLADLYINPSIDESWSMTTIEALSCGTPCICPNIPIFRYHIKEYKNGLLFKINNLEDMFLKIVEGLKMNWNRDEISKNAQIKYNWEKQAVKLLEVYKKIRTGDNNS